MLDSTRPLLSLSIGKYDFEIKQSPGLLKSDHASGTTGAALWRAGIRCAEWLASPTNILVEKGFLTDSSNIIELGAGIAGLSSCVLARRLTGTGRKIATDMHHSMKLLRENITTNSIAPPLRTKKSQSSGGTVKNPPAKAVEVHELDWEQDDAQALLSSIGLAGGVDVIIACDCVYNYALLEPFTNTCASIMSMRDCRYLDIEAGPTVCICVQQLRQPNVIEDWLTAAQRLFDIWRLPSEMIADPSSEDKGFVFHLLRLRQI